jgi:threonyl-tRNA synthetase
MPRATLPDGKEIQFNHGDTIAAIAQKIGAGLAKSAVAAVVDGAAVDLNLAPGGDVKSLKIITADSKEGLDILRHSASHVLAAAVLKVYPDAKLGVGPAVEDGFYYDFKLPKNLSEDDLRPIEAEMAKIIKADEPFTRENVSRDEAARRMREMKQDFKVEMLAEMPESEVSFYRSGDFVDLCRGPHIASTGMIKAFKLTKVAGAYWRGDAKRDALMRIYGTAFFLQKELDEHLALIEEAKKRDHRIVGRQMGLFSFHEEGPGFAFWHPKGVALLTAIESFWIEEHKRRGYQVVRTPAMLNEELWHRSGHYENYREHMYFTSSDEMKLALKPMNCPGTLLIYNSTKHSYRELPLRYAELGQVHRYEMSGVMHGLMRVREFTIDDAHIFCTPEQVTDEVKGVVDLILFLLDKFGLADFIVELSTRPPKSIGSAEMWQNAEGALRKALADLKLNYKVSEGEGAFYGPKIDFHIKDSLKRTQQCGTVQVDFAMPQRFDMRYVGADNAEHRPVMIHRAALGSMERFIGFLIEHYAGRFPTWFAPVQAIVMPITEHQVDYARKVVKALEAAAVRVEIDARNEKIGLKIREATMQKIPYMLVVGEKETRDGTVAVRELDGTDKGAISLDLFVDEISLEIQKKTIKRR